jgi:subtilase family serine protease
LSSTESHAESPRRIAENLEDGRTVVLQGNVHRFAAAPQDRGEVEESFELPRITMYFQMSAAQRADLETLLKQQQDRSSSNYHKWLTPEEYGDRFGINQADLEKISGWLTSRGFSISQSARSRTWVSFEGTAAQVRDAFQTPIHRYVVNGESHYANSSDPVLPRALNGVVLGMRGLNDFHPKPRVKRARAATGVLPRFTSSISGNHFITPDDFATIYDIHALYNSGINGSGQKIVIPGQTDIALSDIEAFRSAAGLQPNDPQIVLDGTDPGTKTGDESESDLDLEWAGAVAPYASVIYVNSTNVFTSVTYAVDNNLAPVMSITYGECEAQIGTAETNSLSATFQQANAQGMTIFAAAGDVGAADCDDTGSGESVATHGLAVDVPASIPYVTGVGGTELSEGSGAYWSSTNNGNGGSALSYIPEIVWNDTAAVGQLAATGGGASKVFPKPSWQVGLNVPSDGARDVPDIAVAASPQHDGYLICSGGDCVNGFRNTDTTLDVVGGTSVGPPTFAGIIALLNQQTNSRQGNINPNLYALASTSTDAFHDITQGNNQVPCRSGSTNCPNGGNIGYVAGPGYDQASGLGSVDVFNMIHEWGSNFQVSINPTSLTIQPGSSGSASVQVTATGNFNGSVSFSCSLSSGLANTSCSIPGTVTGSGTATLTVTAAATADALPKWRGFPFVGGGWGWLAAAAALTLIASLIWLRPRKRSAAFVFGLAVVSILAIASCGDGGSTTTSAPTASIQPVAESGTVTVTATSGVVSHSVSVAVSIP